MTVHSVKGQGQALMTCLAFCVGANQNCGIPLGGGPTGNICSVKTSPSLGDYAAAAVGIMINAYFNSVTALISVNELSIVVAVAQNLEDLGESYGVQMPWYLAPLNPLMAAARAASAITSAAQEQAQKAVDGK